MNRSQTETAFSWGTFDEAFTDELSAYLHGRRVLEVFAGNGLLAAILRKRGVDIHPTTVFRGHDGHEDGLHCEIEELDARVAADRYRDSHDVLLMCWPTPDEVAMQACLLWGGGTACRLHRGSDGSRAEPPWRMCKRPLLRAVGGDARVR